MSKICSICARSDRTAIDQELLAGVPTRRVAERFHTSRDALVRHLANHHVAAPAAPVDMPRPVATPDPAPLPVQRCRCCYHPGPPEQGAYFALQCPRCGHEWFTGAG